MKLINLIHDEEIPDIINFILDNKGYSMVQSVDNIQYNLRNLMSNFEDPEFIKNIGGVNVYVGSEDKADDIWFDTTGDIRLLLRDINMWLTLKGLS